MTTTLTPDLVVTTVLELIEQDGYDAVQLREVARRAQASLSTIYKRFPTRDHLIAAALEVWVAGALSDGIPPAGPGESFSDGLTRVLTHVLGPIERHPRMVEAYYRARRAPGGDRLGQYTWTLVGPEIMALFARAEAEYATDVLLVLGHVAYGVLGRFADGDLKATEILPLMLRVCARLTGDNSAAAEAARAAA